MSVFLFTLLARYEKIDSVSILLITLLALYEEIGAVGIRGIEPPGDQLGAAPM